MSLVLLLPAWAPRSTLLYYQHTDLFTPGPSFPSLMDDAAALENKCKAKGLKITGLEPSRGVFGRFLGPSNHPKPPPGTMHLDPSPWMLYEILTPDAFCPRLRRY
ncbi:hypothetical protein SODALDRAFT_331371 [Sodiomyces alkalinus F11]|uniref:Uncharacterized protein n=1 Tax=Sodiomyces alkalinus (strain CBS 110278 / VKM F-3762 / F11) TaxID=1314773 RepID=A0A3N2Q4B5_SODAK|nr:hypothetical protein SODALDRAFT_331371 [Sodiomyces alkalinus F11]ROT41614.1 hypothetical protein SODALDRAFT_331371 [Sodiomyces alkalinus F11]